MTRHWRVLLHRYAGLTVTLFLIIVGLTGSVLAFYHELKAGGPVVRYPTEFAG